MSPALTANFVALCAILSTGMSAFAESPATDSQQVPAWNGLACEADPCDPDTILDQLIYLLPAQPGKKGFSIFIRGGASASDWVPTK